MSDMRLQIKEDMARAAAKIDVTKPLEPQPKPFRKNISVSRNKFEKENNNDSNETKNKRNSLEIKKDDESNNVKIQNGNNENITPPKPMPRATRTGSLSESTDEVSPKPVARPRNNSVITNQPNPTPQMGFISSVNVTGGYKVSQVTNCSCLTARVGFDAIESIYSLASSFLTQNVVVHLNFFIVCRIAI
jgi:hypothetical protein